MQVTAPYSHINYGFTFLTENPLPKQDSCANSSDLCPIWDGQAIYIAQSYKTESTVVNFASDVHSIDGASGLISISEVCRMARQGPTGPKRCLISFGGWSDWARIGNVANAKQIAILVGKMVLYSFADGVDLDFEHLKEYSWIDGGNQEYDAFNALVEAIRGEFNKITPAVWANTISARLNDLQTTYNAMPAWQKAQSPFYPTNMKYMQDLKSNPPPYFEISWTTRFNAFLNKSNPLNYLDPSSPKPPPFATDNEGTLIWPVSGKFIDSINVMAYDGGSPAGPLVFNFQNILMNFKAFGPKASQVNMGFEPGDQNAGGKWEGLAKDQSVARFIKDNGFGGGMVWAINPDPTVHPEAAQWCPVVAQALNTIIQPQWPFGKPPITNVQLTFLLLIEDFRITWSGVL
jgi:hypothetical protein